MSRKRLDIALCERGLETSRARARARIMAGECRVDGEPVTKPGHAVSDAAVITLVGGAIPFVSRGGLKLEQALDEFGIDVTGLVAMDVGASTGGFTDCLLQRGATCVFAIDVGYGQLAWKLRNDPRVVVLERTNIRALEPDAIDRRIDLAVVDCSFISLRTVFPAMRRFLLPGATVVALVKPQFEAGRQRLGKGGVVRDAEIRDDVIAEVVDALAALGLDVRGGVDCATAGPKGNVEYLLWGQVSESASPSA